MLTRLTQFDFYEAIDATPGLAVVLFSAASCGSCRHWKQFLAAYRDAHPEISIFEVDAGLEPALAQEFELFHLPALFLFQDGEYHAAVQCEPRDALFAAELARLLQLPAEEAP